MVKRLLSTAFFAAMAVFAQSQTIWAENFDASTSLPAGWTQTTAATDGGWKVGTATDLSSQFFGGADRGGNVLGTNDDACNCDKSKDIVITPKIDLTGQTDIRMLFDMVFFSATYQGSTETLKIIATTDGGTTWSDVLPITTGSTGWRDYFVVDISAFAGKADVQFGFQYNDGGGWLYGTFIDNVRVVVYDTVLKARLNSVVAARYVNAIPRELYGYTHMKVGQMIPTVRGTVFNYGFPNITQYDVKLTSSQGTTTLTVDNLDLAIGQSSSWSVPVDQAVVLGDNDFQVEILNVNGVGDNDPADNSGGVTVTGIEPSKDRKVVVEEGTGTWCGWCPRGTVMMDFLKEEYPDNLIPIAVHNAQSTYPDPMQNSVYNAGMVSLIGGFPSGLVDRTYNDVDPTEFEQYALAQMAEPASVVVTQNVEFNATTRNVTVVSSLNFKEALNGDYAIAVAYTEDGVKGTTQYYGQTNYYAANAAGVMGGWESLPATVAAANMTYDHVARQIVGGFTGKPGSVPANNPAGSVMSYTSNYVLPATYNVDNMHAVTMLIDQSTGQIINAEATPIPFVSTGANDLKEETLTASIFPNPVSDESTLTLYTAKSSDVQVRIVDAFGRVVSEQNYTISGKQFLPLRAGSLANGMYTLTATANGQMISKPFVIAR
ncbi:MAG: Omp28-related outer membrane protein [Saprospiraceae bacterium]|nr:Omp28-related outer membrane protein [Saprospiraceae bacterium]